MKNKLRIDFSNGEAAQHVTGSCIYLPDLEILLECGFSQSNNLERDFRDNGAKFNFSCKKLKYIFIGHTHLDHVGRLPLLYKRGCDAPIIVSKGTLPLLKNMLEDSAKINERDAELLSKQKGRSYGPIYNLDDVNNAIAHVVEYEQNIIWELTDELSFRFIPSGHIKFSEQKLSMGLGQNNEDIVVDVDEIGLRSEVVRMNKTVLFGEQLKYEQVSNGYNLYVL